MKRVLLIALLLLLFVENVIAHPHIFIDIQMEINDGGRAKILWTFDLIESLNRLYYFDDDEDGQLNSSEVLNLYNESFINIKDYNYFISVNQDENQEPVTNIEDFSAYIEDDGRLTVSFFIDVPDVATYNITHFDTTYFIAFAEPDESNITVKNLYTKIYKDKTKPIYYDPNGGREEVLDTSKPKPGWLKAYPTRVYISRNPIELTVEDTILKSEIVTIILTILTLLLIVIIFYRTYNKQKKPINI